MKTKIEIICPIHKSFYQVPKNHIVLGTGCPKCAKNYKDNNKTFIYKSNIQHDYKYNYSKVNYVDSNTKVEIICKKHGSFYTKPTNHITNNSGCPKCKSSKGESLIRNLLIKYKIKYFQEFKFNLCRDKQSLPFDFYIPDKDILIEFDGEHHFKIKDFFGGEDRFRNIQRRDKIKNTFCKDYNIKIIRIKYTEMKKIKEKLKEILNG